MNTIKQLLQNRWIMAGTILCLALYYALVFLPLSHRAATLDKPLDNVWRELVDFSQESSGVRGLDLNQIQTARQNLSASLVSTEQNRQAVSARVELEPEIRAKMNEPFFLVDFQNERQKRIEQLTALAKAKKVTIDPAVLDAFPEYKVETRDPSLLWAQLSIAHHVLTVAINSKVAQVKRIALLPPRQETGTDLAKIIWQEIPMHIEIIAPMTSAGNFLSAMPLRSEEIKAAGLPESLPGKPSLFLGRLILRKQTPENPDDASLDVVISGFLSKSSEPPNRSQGGLP